jgi:hypothetical protein
MRSGSLSSVAAVGLLSVFLMQGAARAAAGDCTQIDTNAAATILGVSAVRVNVNSQGRHSKLPPDNMDLLTCGYLEASLDPTVRTLSYSVFTPIPSDLASVFGSLSKGNFPGAQSFSPGIGQSTAWYRASASDSRFEGYLALLTSSSVVTIKIAGMPSSASVEAALISAAKKFSKP